MSSVSPSRKLLKLGVGETLYTLHVVKVLPVCQPGNKHMRPGRKTRVEAKGDLIPGDSV